MAKLKAIGGWLVALLGAVLLGAGYGYLKRPSRAPKAADPETEARKAQLRETIRTEVAAAEKPPEVLTDDQVDQKLRHLKLIK